MSGRRRKSLAPSLFPFLAVLVCTLGTLILLLALVAQKANDAAAEVAEQKRKEQELAVVVDDGRPSKDEVQAQIDENAFRVEQLVMIRSEQTADIERRRDEITQVESHMQRIRQKLKRLNDEVELANSDTNVVADETKLNQLRTQVRAKLASVKKLQEEKAYQKPRVAIVPHKGPNGTDRRPIYLECTQRGLTIWPEESEITLAQLQESVPGANPLDAALRGIRRYAMQVYGDQVAPYPMLIVRPDGIETYAAARVALHDWDDQFGYELVPADMRLAYDKSDSVLKTKIEQAIHNAVIQQHGLNAIARRAGTSSYSGRVAGDRRRYPRLSASAMDERGRSSGFADHRDFSNRQSYAPRSSSMSYQNHLGGGTGADFARGLDERLKNAASEIRDQEENGGSKNSASPASNPFLAPNMAGESRTDSKQSGLDHGRGRDPNNGMKGGTSDIVLSGPKRSLDANSSRSTVTDLELSKVSSNNARTNIFLSPTVPQDATVRAESNPFAMPNQTSPRDGESSNGAEFRSLSDSPANDSSTGQTHRPGTTSSQATKTNGRQAQNTNAAQPPNSASATITKDLVKRTGANWALPKEVAMSRGNAIVRTIRVRCYPTHLILLPSSVGGAKQFFGLNDTDMNQATLELATAVRDQIARWGAAIPGGRWQPRLDIEVAAGGEQRFYDLKHLMTGSGIEIQGKRASNEATR